jgi:two-component system sensor histidine kinase DegS
LNMQLYLSEITKAQEEERKRIAREIHDEIIQSLAALSLEIDVLCQDKTGSRDDLMTRLQGIRSDVLEVVDKLRRFTHELHPSVIDQGLIPALENLTQEISRANDINAQITIFGDEQRLSEEMELCLFRIAQEAMRNIVKHAAATKATIKLRYTANTIKLTISDNGVGFELPEVMGDLASKHKLGIISMQERSRLIEGKLYLRSRAGKGTTVIIEAPIKF